MSPGLVTPKNAEVLVSACVTGTSDSQSLLTRLLPGGPLFTLEEAAQYLAVETALLEKLISEKALRVLRIGPEVRILPEDLKAFVAGAEE
jgi:excisionase family DNA binding protein